MKLNMVRTWPAVYQKNMAEGLDAYDIIIIIDDVLVLVNYYMLWNLFDYIYTIIF